MNEFRQQVYFILMQKALERSFTSRLFSSSFFLGTRHILFRHMEFMANRMGKKAKKKTLCLEIAAAQQRTFARKSIQMYGIHIGP